METAGQEKMFSRCQVFEMENEPDVDRYWSPTAVPKSRTRLLANLSNSKAEPVSSTMVLHISFASLSCINQESYMCISS